MFAGTADPAKTSLKGEEYAALVLCRLVQTQSSAAVQVPVACCLCLLHLLFDQVAARERNVNRTKSGSALKHAAHLP